jgi:hypothetical protein
VLGIKVWIEKGVIPSQKKRAKKTISLD